MTKAFRDRLSRLLGRKPAQMQVAALCRSRQDGKVLLVTSRGTGRWIVPKGWPMPGRTLADAALQEAWEEAGVLGTIGQDPIGSYHYDKVQDLGFSVPVEVRVYLLDVESLADDWLESGQRKRRWFEPARAAELVAETGLKRLLAGMVPAGGSPA
ncbi:NUDIX hydrolase [Paracoccus yeei]|uniref:NUDIX domain-containing protein n=2 Tax=Paracoccus yeei TaxID=147645 RepID=A0A386UNG2_9RHOB|nr:NUDIX hydrolase [Paracoccus yeei]AYF02101.1 NUDIX domain-containing protein [Paracoccus yeei]